MSLMKQLNSSKDLPVNILSWGLVMALDPSIHDPQYSSLSEFFKSQVRVEMGSKTEKEFLENSLRESVQNLNIPFAEFESLLVKALMALSPLTRLATLGELS